MALKVYLVAGEPSGDKLAASLVMGLRDLMTDVEFRGVAGPLMQEAGMTSLFPMNELSVMGVSEILPKYRALMARINQTAADVIDWQPDVLITVDSPDFSSRVARRVKAKSAIRIVHYVAPSVWVWRKGRAAKLAKIVDQVLALLPFEPPYMDAVGLRCDFVGHPVVTDPEITPDSLAAFRGDLGLAAAERSVVLLPGSRRSEVTRLMGGLQEALALAGIGGKDIILPTLPHMADTVRSLLHDDFKDALVLDGAGLGAEEAALQRRHAMAHAEFALAASGTVSLELASVKTPMVIAYDMAWLSRMIIGWLLLLDTVTLVNLVSETRTVPEFLGKDFQPSLIAAAIRKIRSDSSDQQAAMDVTMTRLGQGGEKPGIRAARAVLDGLGVKP